MPANLYVFERYGSEDAEEMNISIMTKQRCFVKERMYGNLNCYTQLVTASLYCAQKTNSVHNSETTVCGLEVDEAAM